MSLVVACSKLWRPDIANILSQRTGEDFKLIADKNQLTPENLKKWQTRKIFFPHWSYILKPEIYDNFECVMFHMTDLPFGRGGSPLQNLVSRGHKKTKISAFRCDGGVDTGPIYLKRDLDLAGRAQDIFVRATDTIIDMIAEIIKTQPQPTPQKGPVTEFKRRTPAEGNLENAQNLEGVYDFIRMLDADGYPPAFLVVNGVKFEFTEAKMVDGKITATVRITKNEKN